MNNRKRSDSKKKGKKKTNATKGLLDPTMMIDAEQTHTHLTQKKNQTEHKTKAGKEEAEHKRTQSVNTHTTHTDRSIHWEREWKGMPCVRAHTHPLPHRQLTKPKTNASSKRTGELYSERKRERKAKTEKCTQFVVDKYTTNGLTHNNTKSQQERESITLQ